MTPAPGAAQTVRFPLNRDSVGFYGNDGKFVVEPGRINVYAGDSSAGGLTSSFTVADR